MLVWVTARCRGVWPRKFVLVSSGSMGLESICSALAGRLRISYCKSEVPPNSFECQPLYRRCVMEMFLPGSRLTNSDIISMKNGSGVVSSEIQFGSHGLGHSPGRGLSIIKGSNPKSNSISKSAIWGPSPIQCMHEYRRLKADVSAWMNTRSGKYPLT